MIIDSAASLAGTIRVPGDKSIAHRALMLGAIAAGEQVIENVPVAADVASTIACIEALGARIQRASQGDARNDTTGNDVAIRVTAHPFGSAALDAGNSGTTARLISGLLAGRHGRFTIDGDDSLRRRPMERIAEPLRQMGATIETASGTLPITIDGSELEAIDFLPDIASAQVKSAVLFAGLSATGVTSVEEKLATRDHSERMLAVMGADITTHGKRTEVRGPSTLQGTRIIVPGDFSSAAYFIAAALLVPRSEIRISDVGLNETRTGLLRVLADMGANITVDSVSDATGEPIGTVIARASSLQAIHLGAEDVPAIIDELPLLALLASQAEGKTVVTGAAELRHKESDRIATTCSNLSRMGANIEAHPDGFVVRGPARLAGGAVTSHGDHRLAMTLAVAGLCAQGTTKIGGSDAAAVSYPGFYDALRSLVIP